MIFLYCLYGRTENIVFVLLWGRPYFFQDVKGQVDVPAPAPAPSGDAIELSAADQQKLDGLIMKARGLTIMVDPEKVRIVFKDMLRIG